MTQKALYKKIELCNPWATAKEHKRYLPTRAKSKSYTKAEVIRSTTKPDDLYIDALHHQQYVDFMENDLLLESVGINLLTDTVKYSTDCLQHQADNDSIVLTKEEIERCY